VKRTSAGALRHRVVLQQPVRVDDGGGGATQTWQTVAELWAAVTSIGGEERLSADALTGRVTHEVWIRYRPGVTPAMRFQHAGRILEIRAVLEAGNLRHRLQCLCLERDL
jgi:SPP1 family predicted phage head-tail adaptor